ncbi:MAG TPA: T9SS type A sorting domain-containing protein, partial [Anaerolineae bacterium]|nr:T9SS type A sorting domain-containing protein [Anaerolineae bacterium]
MATANRTNVQNVASGSFVNFSENCELIASLQSGGAQPVSGSVSAKLWLDAQTPSYNGRPYLRRRVEMTPASNAASATGTITLYFTQADFDNFNAIPFNGPDLPTDPDDEAGKLNFAIYKYSGTSSDGSGLPGTYQQPGVLITVPAVALNWNVAKQWWEATFSTTGFSGLFAGNIGNTILPSSELLAFNVFKQGNSAVINWQVATSNNAASFVVEKSVNGRDFTRLKTTAAAATTTVYQETDASLQAGLQYYRIRMVEKDGSISFSAVKAVRGGNVASVMVYPNPAKNMATVEVNAGTSGKLHLKLADAKGQAVWQQNLQAVRGTNFYTLPLAHLAAGLYMLYCN